MTTYPKPGRALVWYGPAPRHNVPGVQLYPWHITCGHCGFLSTVRGCATAAGAGYMARVHLRKVHGVTA